MIITNCNLNSPVGKAIENGYIAMKDEKIIEIGEMANLKYKSGRMFDAKGMFALPGLVDAHSHLGLFADGLGVEGDDGNESTDPVTPHIRAIDGLNPLDKSFSEALDWGVTTVVVGPGSSNPISGQICALKTRGICVDDMVVEPALAMKMSLGENPKETYLQRAQFPTTRMATAALIRDTLNRAKRYRDDMLLYKQDKQQEVELPDYDAKLEALVAVLAGKIRVHFHVHRADDIFTALRLAKEFSFEVVLIHATEAHLAVSGLDSLNTKIVCGPILGTRSKPELVGFTRKLPAILCSKKIKFAICTDHPEFPQECLMLSAHIAHREGLERDEAIRSVTLTPAEICGIENRVGSINVGKDADVILFDEDPLKGFIKPKAVFCRGVRVR
jgi:imidazolonepropionase-like amidohydrolase